MPWSSSSQNVPVLKLTFKAEGQSVLVNSVTVNKLGLVAGNLVTIRIYRDVNNDTVNKLGADDVEVDPTHANNFDATNRITFLPDFWVTPGTDYNLLIVYSLNLGTAGWTLGCSVSAGGVGTTTALPNEESAFPNDCLNVTRNPPFVMTSRTVPIMDRGQLSVNMEDLSPPAPSEGSMYSWMKLSFWGEGEKIDVNRIKFSAYNETGHKPSDWTDIRIGIFHDLNNNSIWDIGFDTHIADTWFNSFGDAVFFAAPLFEVRQRTTYNLLVIVNPTVGSAGNFSLNVTFENDIQSKGQVSSLSIPPTGSFPMSTTEREILP